MLKDGKGYSAVYDHTTLLQNGGRLEVSDFTLEPNGNLNIVHYMSYPTQQSQLADVVRLTKNLNTKVEVPQPSDANNLANYIPEFHESTAAQERRQVFAGFRPFTNHFTWATQINRSGGGFYSTDVIYQGDITGSFTRINGGVAGMSYLFPVLSNNYFSFGSPNPTYLLSSVNPAPFSVPSRQGATTITVVPEPRTGNASLLFALRTDSLVVYSYDIATSTPTLLAGTSYTSLTGAKFLTTINSVTSYEPQIKKNYSADGKRIGMLFRDVNSGNCWSFTYDAATKTLTKVLDNAPLSYAGTGTDFDVDEMGNAYYSGYAGNGANQVGVSFYKKGISGESLVGGDDVLKFGQVIKLKILGGKLFFALTGKHTGTSIGQTTIIRQD